MHIRFEPLFWISNLNNFVKNLKTAIKVLPFIQLFIGSVMQISKILKSIGDMYIP